MIRVSSVRCLDGFALEVGFTDSSVRPIDIEPFLVGPMFGPLREDRALFAAVFVDPTFGTLAWPNGADLCPEVLREDRRPATWGCNAA